VDAAAAGDASLGVVRPEVVVASKTAALKQVGLVVDDPFPFPRLFVRLEVGALKPMQADAVMVAGRWCDDEICGNTVSHRLFQNGDRWKSEPLHCRRN
jgi:hypothetical protein